MLKLSQRFRDLSLRIKIGLILLFFLGLALLNYFLITGYHRLQARDTVVVDVAGRQRMLSQRIAFYAEQIYQGRQEHIQIFQDLVDLCGQSLITLKEGGQAPGMEEGTILSPSPPACMPALDAAENLWNTYREQALAVLSDDPEVARAAIQYLEDWSPEILTRFNNMVKAYVLNNQEKQLILHRIMLAILLLNVLVILGVFAALYFLILDPVNRISSLIGDLARGDLRLSAVKVRGRDEIGRALLNLKELITSLQAAAGFAEEISEGNLAVNYQLLSEHDELGASLLKMRARLNAIIDQTNEVIRIADKQGELNTRIETAGMDGAWKELADSINDLLHSFTRPITAINHLAEALSNGYLRDRLELEAKGDIGILVTNLNQGIASIDAIMAGIHESAGNMVLMAGDMLSRGRDIGHSTSEITISINQLTEGAHLQAQRIEDASERIEKVLEASKLVTNKSEDIRTAARKGLENSQMGEAMMSEVVSLMHVIDENVVKTGKAMQSFIARSEEISNGLKVISAISAQTNLLALNAGIEASRAGEAGKGFSVIAREIRVLAENSKNSEKEISQLLEEAREQTTQTVNAVSQMTALVKEGVGSTQTAREVLTELFTACEQTFDYAQHITEAAQQQLEQLNGVITLSENVAVIAEESATATEEINSASVQINSNMDILVKSAAKFNEMAQSMKSSIDRFSITGKRHQSTVSVLEPGQN